MSLPPPLPSQTRVSTPTPERRSVGVRLLGLLLVVPAFVVALFALWIPTLRLFQLASSVGSLATLPLPTFVNDAGFTAGIAVIRVVASLFAAVFGISVAFLGPIGRNLFRTVFLIPVLLLAPMSFGFSFMMLAQGLGVVQAQGQVFTLLAEAFLSFAALILVALWLFPATRVDATEKKSQIWTRLVLAIFLALTAFATGLQAFALSSTVNAIAGMKAQSLAVRATNLTYMFNEKATAQLDVIMFVLLAFLGFAASIVLVATNFRLDLHRFVSPKKSAGWWVGIVLGFCVFAVVAAIIATFFSGFLVYSAKFASSSLVPHSEAGPNEFGPLISSLGNMVLPVFGWLCVSSFLTYLAAFGIGALRPLGRYSEWLLLPFFPYLFVAVVTLSPVYVDTLTKLKLFDTPFSIFYPLLVSVPQLIFLTLFFKGQVSSRAEAQPRPSFARGVFLPSIPVAITLAVVAALFAVRDSYWYVTAVTKLKTPPILYFEGFETYNLYSLCYYPLAVSVVSLVLLFPVFAVLQIFVVDQLRIRTGRA